jgi:hypothetical protein
MLKPENQFDENSIVKATQASFIEIMVSILGFLKNQKSEIAAAQSPMSKEWPYGQSV